MKKVIDANGSTTFISAYDASFYSDEWYKSILKTIDEAIRSSCHEGKLSVFLEIPLNKHFEFTMKHPDVEYILSYIHNFIYSKGYAVTQILDNDNVLHLDISWGYISTSIYRYINPTNGYNQHTKNITYGGYIPNYTPPTDMGNEKKKDENTSYGYIPPCPITLSDMKLEKDVD